VVAGPTPNRSTARMDTRRSRKILWKRFESSVHEDILNFRTALLLNLAAPKVRGGVPPYGHDAARVHLQENGQPGQL
jgi:hypothetical protein